MAKQKEKVIATRLGKRVIDPDKVLYFPHGLIGFENQREFVLLQIKDGSPFLILQSLSNSRVGLVVADPYSFTADYEVKIGDAEQKILKLKTIRQVAVLVTVTIPPGAPEKTALNLSGPILVNYEARVGLQVPQSDPKYAGHLYLHETVYAQQQGQAPDPTP
jgi:flagellar assembly factor FliW